MAINKQNIAVDKFLELLRAGLWENSVRLSGCIELDFEKIYKLAQEQAVLGLTAAGLEQVIDVKVPKEIALSIAGEMLQIEQHNTAMNYFIGVLIEKLADAGISSLLIKGQGIAQCYERPLWRSCGDVDLVLDKENYDKAKQYLIPLAAHIEDEDCNRLHLGMTIDSWVVELHGTLHTEINKKIDTEIDDTILAIFQNRRVRIWKNGKTDVNLPAPTEDVIIVFTHILQHFYQGGIGLRQICDWCRLLWTYRSEIDSEQLSTCLNRMGVINEWISFAALSVEYLGVPVEAMPFYSRELKWKRRAESILSLILETGNFGHNRLNGQASHSMVIRKIVSFGRATWDSIRMFFLFPKNSFAAWRLMVRNGIKDSVRGK